jgi:hypothetical protein
MPGLNIPFSSNVRKALFMLVVIKSSSVVNLKLVQKFCVNQRFDRILSPDLILLVLVTTLRIKINVSFGHALHSTCIWESSAY